MDVKEWQKNERWTFGCFLIASGLILFFNLWGRSLENHGYIRYAEIAREMIRSRDWIVPRLNGEIFIDKPPLLFWLIAIPSSIYGSVTPFIARLPSVFSAWIGVAILFLWGKRVYGTTQSGLIAGGVLLSSYQYFFQSRLAKTDILLSFFILLSLYFFYLGYSTIGRRRKTLFHGLSFFSIGLGVLTKGPFGLFIPLFIISVFLIQQRQWRIFISKEFILGYIIFVLTVLPWIFLFIHCIGLEQYLLLVKQNPILSRRAPFYFYFIQIWGQFFPWSLLLPILALYLWRRRRESWHAGDSFFLLWFFVLFFILTLFKFKAARYLLPVFPPLAILIGGMWRKKFLTFLIPFLLTILIWHGCEFHWISKDLFYSPGMVLTKELKLLTGESTLYGYQLDQGTVEEINFYLDRIIPLLKGRKSLLNSMEEKERRLVLMPREVYQRGGIIKNPSIHFVQEFQYKKGKLVLVSNEFTRDRERF